MGPRELSIDGFGVEKKVLMPMPASWSRAMKADSRIQETLCPMMSAGRVVEVGLVLRQARVRIVERPPEPRRRVTVRAKSLTGETRSDEC